MQASDIGRELVYPLRNTAIVFAMLFYWLLFGLAQHARLFGIALLFLTLPAYLRYLLFLLEARANGRPPPIPEIAMFNPADNFWTLTPMIHIAVATWAGILLAKAISPFGAMLFAVAFMAFVPASMANLAITHSPGECLNPAALLRMIRACGAPYLAVPIILVLMSGLFVLLYVGGVPLFLIDLGTSYQIVVLFSMTGAVLYANNVAMQVDIAPAAEPTADEIARDLDHYRQKVANHAYGFISRGNRQGGFAHIRQWLEKETAVEEAWRWFFDEMLHWEDKDPALFFAQEYLRCLLEWRMDKEALKLIARCLHENARWRPQPETRDDATELALRHNREDLLALLQR